MDRNKKAQEKHPFSALIIQNFIGGYLPSRVSFQPILHRPDFVRQYKKRRQFSLFSLFSLSSPCGVACCGLWIGGGVLPLACMFVSLHIIPQNILYHKNFHFSRFYVSSSLRLLKLTFCFLLRYFLYILCVQKDTKKAAGKTRTEFSQPKIVNCAVIPFFRFGAP